MNITKLISYLPDNLKTTIIDFRDVSSNGKKYIKVYFDMGCMLYNCRRDLVYILSFSELDEITKSGLTMKLHAHIPDKWDRETIENEMGA